MAPNFLPSVVGNPLSDSFPFSLILHRAWLAQAARAPPRRLTRAGPTSWWQSNPQHGGFNGQPAVPVWRAGGNQRQEKRGCHLYFNGPHDPDRFSMNATRSATRRRHGYLGTTRTGCCWAPMTSAW